MNTKVNLLFSSKANTLDFFHKKIKKSKIEKFYFFTERDWNDNEKNILKNINQNFKSKIVIRSSALGEDSEENSQAGKFTTILNINPNNRSSVIKAINSVIRSYQSEGSKDSLNQILIQKQTLDSITSGVIFTKTLRNGSPYYVINYEDSKSTDSVTKGITNTKIEIYNETDEKIIPKKWLKLISAVKEIQTISKNEKLDIEFAITKNTIIIFQVRPLTAIHYKNYKKISQYVKKQIEKNEKKFEFILKSTKQNNLIFSNMTDWNPAEIIGEKPKNLDYSLYDFLIMKSSWNKGRIILGYNNVEKHLMENFSGRGYVNVVASFESLIPKSINNKIQRKLLTYYLKKLKNNPEFHDKVEFDILFTCYDFNIKKRLLELKKFGLSRQDRNDLKNHMLKFTNGLIERTPEILSHITKSLEELERKRLEKNNFKGNYNEKFSNAFSLLKDCRDLGAIQFSAIARLAFVSTILLKTISDVSKMKKNEIEQIMNSISTPVSEFKNDLGRLHKKEITQKYFLLKYGHLRPGTYDITADRYDKMSNILSELQDSVINRNMLIQKKKSSRLLKTELKKHGLKFNNIDFFDFVTKTIGLREQIKFEFTKSLSDSIELIASAGNELGFSRDELSYLTIDDISKSRNWDKKRIQNMWQDKIKKQKEQYFLNEFVEIPPLITAKDEFSIISHYIAKPNYITKKKISSDIVLINELEKGSDIVSRIILIENADPGYDWIFGKNPNGLITKYGGVASHMAIRCTELGLPAAIGCGQDLFDKLKTCSKLELDCKNGDITILDFKSKDSFLEEKKILRSLGYIR